MNIIEFLTLVNRTVMQGKKNKYIVIHYVGAVSTAKNNADYFHSVNRQASANYFVDENDFYRVVRDEDAGWHCGTNGKYYCGARNTNSIGIEMCCYMNNGKLDISEKVVSRTIELTKYLMAKYNIPIENVVRHYDVTRKLCPEPFVSNESRWIDFKNRLKTQTTNSNSLYKVQVGAYKYKSNADSLSNELKKKGIDTYIVVVDNLFKVQCGAYRDVNNAKAMASKINSLGYETYITGLNESQTPTKGTPYRINCDYPNIRSGPSLNSSIVRRLAKGTIIYVIGTENGFYKLSDGTYLKIGFADKV